MDFIWQFSENYRSYAGDLYRDADKADWERIREPETKKHDAGTVYRHDARLINRLMNELETLLKHHSIHKPEEECRVD